MNTRYFTFWTLLLCLIFVNASAEIRGRVDAGPAYLIIDILKSGKTEDTLYMRGFKADATILLYEGICVKPSCLFGWKRHGELSTGSIAVGYYLPLFKCFSLLPNVGIAFSYLRTNVSFEEFQLFHLKERFRSSSPFIGFDFSITLAEKWSIYGTYQYAWSRTHTKISKIGVSDTSHSDGPNYNLGIEYSLNPNWAINFGVGYNLTLSHEKHGLRGKGAKLGVAYYF